MSPPGSARRLAILALAVTAAGLPLYVVRWHVGPVPTTLLEVLIGITTVLYVLTLVSEKRLPAARTPYDIPIALLLVAAVIGIAVSPDHTRAIGIVRAYFVEAVLIFYIAVDLIRTPADVRRLLLVAAVGASIMALGQIVSFAWVLAHMAHSHTALPLDHPLRSVEALRYAAGLTDGAARKVPRSTRLASH